MSWNSNFFEPDLMQLPFLSYIIISIIVFTYCQNNQVLHSEDDGMSSLISRDSVKALHLSWVKGIKVTKRINGNLYSDFVADSKGNLYVASFYTGPNQEDYIYIAKISGQGEIIWESNPLQKGRANGISIDPKGNLWITGYFNHTLSFGDQHVNAESGPTTFLATFSPNGKCRKLITASGSSIGFNCYITSKGTVILTGTSSSSEIFPGTFSSEPHTGDQFIAAFDLSGQCQWIKYWEGQVRDIQSDKEGNIYISGSFKDSITFDLISLRTASNYDYDGVLLKISPLGKGLWMKQFGEVGSTRYGYRTYDGGFDIIVDEKNDIKVAARLEYPSEQETPYKYFIQYELLTFNSTGTLISRLPITKKIPHSTVITFTSNTHSYFFTLNCTDSCFFNRDIQIQSTKENPANYIVQYYPALDTFLYQPLLFDGMFRVMKTLSDTVYISGHFKDSIHYDQKNIYNTGDHELFISKWIL